jgi:hypothetical protein
MTDVEWKNAEDKLCLEDLTGLRRSGRWIE